MAKRVLFVEDDRVSVEYFTPMLEAIGCEVRWVGDGMKAISEVFREPPHLILLDLELPKMDGYTVCQTLKRSFPDTPIIILTSHDSFTSRVRSVGEGADDYLSKPCSKEELEAKLKPYLHHA